MPLELPYVDDIARSYANVFQPFADTRAAELRRKQALEDAARIRTQQGEDAARLRTQQLADQEHQDAMQRERDFRLFDLKRAGEEADQETQRQRFFDEEEARLEYAKQLAEFQFKEADKAKKADLLEKARAEAIASGADVKDTDTIGDLVLKKEEQNGKRLEAALGEMGKVQSEYFQASGRDVQARVKQETDLALQDPIVRKTVPMEDQAKLVSGTPVTTVLDQYSRTNPKGWQALHDALFNAHRQLLQEDAQNDQGKEVILNLNKRLTQASKDVEDAMKLVHNPQAVINGYSARRAAETAARPTQTGPNLTLPPPGGGARVPQANPLVPVPQPGPTTSSNVPVIPAQNPFLTRSIPSTMLARPVQGFTPADLYTGGRPVVTPEEIAARRLFQSQQQDNAMRQMFLPTVSGPVVPTQ